MKRASLALRLALGVALLGGATACRPEAALHDNGRRVVFHEQQEPDALNPLISDMMATVDAARPVLEGLVVIDDQLKFQPVLCTQVPTVENGLVRELPGGRMQVTYPLRQGVRWHDGRPFTAEDVIATWKAFMHPRSLVTSRQGYDKIERMEAQGPHRLVMHFKEVYAPYPLLFTFVLPAHVVTPALADPQGDSINKLPFNRHPIGTGPYRFKEWVSGDHLDYEANPDYWRGKPKLDGLTMRIVPDENAAFTLLKSGELDLYQTASLSQYEALKRLEHVEVDLVDALTWEHLDFNLAQPVFQDLRVRRAIAHAINKKQISEKIYLGLYQVADSDQSPLSWAFNPAVKNRYPYDPAKAEALLEEAGWVKGSGAFREKDGQVLRIRISTTAGRKLREMTELVLKYYFKKVGIDLVIENAPGAVYFGPHPSGTLKGGHFDLGMAAWVANADPDNLTLWHSSQIPPKGQNHVQLRHAELDALMEKGTKVLARAERTKIYHRTAEILANELPIIPLFYWKDLNPHHKRLQGFRSNPASAGNLWNVWAWSVQGAKAEAGATTTPGVATEGRATAPAGQP